MALDIFSLLENLCTALQGRHQTVSGMLSAVAQTKERLLSVRNNDSFSTLFTDAETVVVKMQLDPITMPRCRRVPKRIDDAPSASHEYQDSQEYYRQIYYTLIDTAVTQLSHRFDQESLATLLKLEQTITSGVVADVVRQYPEIDFDRLKVQLTMFRSSYNYTSVDEALVILSKASTEVQRLFSEVAMLFRCLLVVPATSCEAERSFSALKRLKTYLRSTMTQTRLNSVAVCHVHAELCGANIVPEVMRDFAKLNNTRLQLFGLTRD
jgi:hypothetical protein